MAAPVVEREVEVDLSTEELWQLISTAEGWARWLVDEASIDVREGATGVVVDDQSHRLVAVEHVGDREVRFVWRGDDDEVSRVTLRIEFGTIESGTIESGTIESGPIESRTIDDSGSRPRLRITEAWLAPLACADCPLRAGVRWELRTCLLCLASCVAVTTAR